MSASVLPPGTFVFEFNGIELHGVATDSTDDIQWRIAVHEFDRRAGAQTENMGRAPWQQRVTLLWIGEDGFSRATNFMLTLERSPSGLLVHPIYGKRQATCSGTQGARLSAHDPNTYVMPVAFMEDSLDASIIGEAGQEAEAQAADVNAQAANVLALVTHYSAAAGAIQSLGNAAAAVAVAATANAESTAINTTPLGTMLGALPALTQSAIVAMRLESIAPEVADDVRSCEVMLYACAQLGDAVLAQHPALRDYRVAQAQPLMSLASQLYGADGANRIPELLANNPAIVGQALITPGTVLKVATS